MSDTETTTNANESTPKTNKQTVILALILVLLVVATALVAYSVTSNQYLDQLDEQNEQIHDLQNALRKSNGLPGLDN